MIAAGYKIDKYTIESEQHLKTAGSIEFSLLAKLKYVEAPKF